MKRSQLISIAVHLFAVSLLLLPLGKVPAPKPLASTRDVLLMPALPRMKPVVLASGGGGGPAQLLPASLGSLPRVEPKPMLLPMLRPETNSKLELEPAVELTMSIDPELQKLPQLGSPWAMAGPPSGGNGKDGYIGDGNGGLLGPGNGKKGIGPGGVASFGVSKCGPPVSPIIVHRVDPEFSEEARKAKLQGSILIRAMVTESGMVREPSVQRGLGLGLDEKAIEAVSKWRFKPGQKNCKPAAMPAFFEVNFRLL